MSANMIPNEIWVYVFELATLDDTHRDELSTCMDNAVWFKTIYDVWKLQSPEEISITAQKKRYRTIKVSLSSTIPILSIDCLLGHLVYMQELAPDWWRVHLQSNRDIQTFRTTQTLCRVEGRAQFGLVDQTHISWWTRNY
jgi:hypothetical protein